MASVERMSLLLVDGRGLSLISDEGVAAGGAEETAAGGASCTACWKARANSAMETKRASGCFANARKITVSREDGICEFSVLGGCGWARKCWRMTWPGPPRKGGRPVSS